MQFLQISVSMLQNIHFFNSGAINHFVYLNVQSDQKLYYFFKKRDVDKYMVTNNLHNSEVLEESDEMFFQYTTYLKFNKSGQ